MTTIGRAPKLRDGIDDDPRPPRLPRSGTFPKPPLMKARVTVTLKPGVLDPQGRAIHHALESLGFAGVVDVRQGKLIELELADGTPLTEIEDMGRRLLANPVIENFRVETA